MTPLLAALLVAAAFGAGCGHVAGPAPAPVTVLAAASLTEAFQGLGAGSRVVYSFAGSQQLVAQVKAGAPADVVATADPEAMARLVGDDLVEPPREFAANRLAIAVQPGNPRQIRGLADLGKTGHKVVLADPAVPAGRYARQALDRAGVAVRTVSLELDVKAVAQRVASGEADAGIVYATDVTGSARVAIPEEANVAVAYPVAVVRASRNRPGGQAFVDRLLGPVGREALTARGFGVP